MPIQVRTAGAKVISIARGFVGTGLDTGPPTPPVGDFQPPTAPGVPQFSTITPQSATAQWGPSTDNAAVARYEVSLDGEEWLSVGLATSYAMLGLLPDSVQRLYVRAIDTSENISPQVYGEFSTPPVADDVPPTAPGVPQATGIQSNTATITWTAATDNVAVAGYEYRLNAGAWVSASGLQVTLSGLLPEQSYTVQVRAIDTSDNAGPSSQVVFTTLPASQAWTFNAETGFFAEPGTGREVLDYSYAGVVRWGGFPSTAGWEVRNVATIAALKSEVAAHNGRAGGTVITLAPGQYTDTGSINITRGQLKINLAGVKITHNGQNMVDGYWVIKGTGKGQYYNSTAQIRSLAEKTLVVPGHNFQVGDWVNYQCAQPSDVTGHYKVSVQVGTPNTGDSSTIPWVRDVNLVTGISGNEVTFFAPLQVRHPEPIVFECRKYTSPVDWVFIGGVPGNRCEVEFTSNGGWRDGVHLNMATRICVWDMYFNLPLRHPIGNSPDMSTHCDFRRVEFALPWNTGGGGVGYGGPYLQTRSLWADVVSRDMRHSPNMQQYARGNVLLGWSVIGSDCQIGHTRWVAANLLDGGAAPWQALEDRYYRETTSELYMIRSGFLQVGNFSHDPTGDNNLFWRIGAYRDASQVGGGFAPCGLAKGTKFAHGFVAAEGKHWNGYNVGLGAPRFLIYIEDFLEAEIWDSDFYTKNPNCWGIGAIPGFVPKTENPAEWGYANTDHPFHQFSTGSATWNADPNRPGDRPNTSDVLIQARFHGVNPQKQIGGPITLRSGSSITWDQSQFDENNPPPLPSLPYCPGNSLFRAQLQFFGLAM